MWKSSGLFILLLVIGTTVTLPVEIVTESGASSSQAQSLAAHQSPVQGQRPLGWKRPQYQPSGKWEEVNDGLPFSVSIPAATLSEKKEKGLRVPEKIAHWFEDYEIQSVETTNQLHPDESAATPKRASVSSLSDGLSKASSKVDSLASSYTDSHLATSSSHDIAALKLGGSPQPATKANSNRSHLNRKVKGKLPKLSETSEDSDISDQWPPSSHRRAAKVLKLKPSIEAATIDAGPSVGKAIKKRKRPSLPKNQLPVARTVPFDEVRMHIKRERGRLYTRILRSKENKGLNEDSKEVQELRAKKARLPKLRTVPFLNQYAYLDPKAKDRSKWDHAERLTKDWLSRQKVQAKRVQQR